MQPYIPHGPALLLLMGSFASGCADDSSSSGRVAHQPAPDPLGVYQDQFGASHRIGALAWTIETDQYDFADFDSADDTAIAKNATTNRANAGKFSRFDWAMDLQGQLRACHTVLDAKTLADAAAAERADETNFDIGCSGAEWSILKGPAIQGTYSNEFQTDTIDAERWTTSGEGYSMVFHLLALSNSERYLIAQNDAANGYNPGKFSRFDWVLDATEVLYYCQSRYDAASLEEALAATPADSSDPGTAGCGQFPWSQLTRVAQ